MTSSATSQQRLNPNTPMAFLTPSTAHSYQVSAHIYLVTVAILTWDWLMAMPDEYRILSRGRISASKIVYVSARVFTLAFCLCSAILQVAPMRNCQSLVYAIAVLTILALNTNNILFLFRIRAVYGNSRCVNAFFGLWYLAVLGTSLGVPFVMHAAHIGPTNYCLEAGVPFWTTSTMFANAVNDTLVCLAISYRITSESIGGQGWRAAVRCFCRGDGAPRVAKDLLRNGQLCYLATIALSVLQIILTFATEYVATLTVSVIALENIMTCRVHRAVVLGLIADGEHHGDTPFVLSTIISGTPVTLIEHAFDTKNQFERGGGRAEAISDMA